MATQEDNTEFYDLPLPYAGNKLSEDVERLRALGRAVDAALHELSELVDSRADAQAVDGALDALQEAINNLGAARVRTVNGKAGQEITLVRADLRLGPANGPSATSIAYDPNGRVSVVTETLDAKPAVTTISYDEGGNVKTVVTTYDGRKRTETLTYNNGRLESAAATEGAA
ncbi:hypothetical protein HS961_20445 [Comamonas piscis]|uniref:RHS repeat protein n=1 Tax=Comamonas piscis TaxID=1562974 RepID=A0A7G5ELZ5_9BURK|nr:hypothetical protein [Comamonas piscis]QMV75020.1 hypothetical protein HS961_20445 [Comamonas piscis]WSO33500.1 hypothetical protein VUJ63_20510 [Comamonas piscis]